MTLGTKIDQLIKSIDLLRTEVQNINSKLDSSMKSRLAKLEDKVKSQQETFSKYSKKRILKY